MKFAIQECRRGYNLKRSADGFNLAIVRLDGRIARFHLVSKNTPMEFGDETVNHIVWSYSVIAYAMRCECLSSGLPILETKSTMAFSNLGETTGAVLLQDAVVSPSGPFETKHFAPIGGDDGARTRDLRRDRRRRAVTY